ncbi:AraC-like DNA-binding protein [Prauserella sediminis]|uniref:AraC-like DNA-binding protein n=1 Tax=Prauserella sediminis TaxID=577680 RepID=A0A839XKZ6_9PSEU|nr:helix-turn-helix domain-containing protein [Prauserella sediminis]MBB3664572.1 AraC-like DNA-binding protein [Prauserella sediminis]
MTTVLAPEADRTLEFDTFASTVSKAFVPLETRDAAPGFRGRVRGVPAGSSHVSEVTADAHTVQRTQRTISTSDPGYLKVGLQVRGHGFVTQGDRLACLRPGELALYDTARPYRLRFDQSFEMLVLMFPRQLLRLSDGELSSLTARPMGGESGLNTVAVQLLRRLSDKVTRPDPAVAAHLADSAIELLAALFVEHLGRTPDVELSRPHGALRARIGAFIEANLCDPDLDVPTVAEAHHISVRQLQKIFEGEHATVSGWIRERRLERCRRDLTDPRLAHLPISAVGARAGLHDSAHFVRVFKARYGVTPGAFRRSQQPCT